MIKDALYYADRGWAVFPCRADKTPYTKNGCLDATTDQEQIKKFWEQFPNANIGMNMGMSGMVSLDCDPGYDPNDLAEKFDGYELTNFTVDTPRGGVHYHYRLRSGETIPPSASKVSPHVDVRSFNSYCLLPPSKTSVGDYTWSTDPRDLEGIHPPDRPDELARLASAARNRSEDYDTWIIKPDLPDNVAMAINWLTKEAQVAIEGQGGDHMAYSTAAHLKSFAISPELAIDLLWEHWNPRCQPPWGAGEVDHLRQKVSNAYDYNISPPGNLTPAYKQAKSASLFTPVTRDTIDDVKDKSGVYGRWRFADQDAMDLIKPPEWLIADCIPMKSYVLLYGQPSTCKTFVALDMALSVAHGAPDFVSRTPTWGNHVKTRGPVLFCAGEGRSGVTKRVRAWEKMHNYGGKVPGFVLVDPVPTITSELEDFLEGALAYSPQGYSMVVVDTVGRAMQGVNENAQENASAFTALVQVLQNQLDCTVLAIHHSGKQGKKEPATFRGSSVFGADADTVFRCDREAGEMGVVMHMVKQKDAAEWEWPKIIGLKEVEYADQTTLVAHRPDMQEHQDIIHASGKEIEIDENTNRAFDTRVYAALKTDKAKEWSTVALAEKIAEMWKLDENSTDSRAANTLKDTGGKWLQSIKDRATTGQQEKRPIAYCYIEERQKWCYYEGLTGFGEPPKHD